MRNIIKACGLEKLFLINSFIWKVILKLNNVKVGKNFYIEGSIYLKLKGKNNPCVFIGENVSIFGDLDLRTRESGKIFIGDNVGLDTNIRFVAARDGVITIGSGTSVGCGLVINAGEKVSIGPNVLIGPNVVIQASNHGFNKPGDIMGQPYIHKPISVGKGSWLAANVVLLPGCHIGEGVIIGASSVVTRSVESNSISVGIPSRVKSKREF